MSYYLVTNDVTMVVGRDLREVTDEVRLSHWSSTDWDGSW